MPQPVTSDAVADIFPELGLEYQRRGDIVATGFPAAAMHLTLASTPPQLPGAELLFDAMWRGHVPLASAPQLLSTVNRWNGERPVLTLTMQERTIASVTEYTVAMRRRLNVTGGATHQQLGAFVAETFNGVVECCAWLAERFPAAVTWEEEA